MNALLQGIHLTRVFHDANHKVCAVNDVSIDLYPGMTLGVVGESGSGKSTLAQMVGGLLKPTKGRIVYDGMDTTTLTRVQRRVLRRDVQFVFQSPVESMNPRFTVMRVLTDPLIAARENLTRSQRTHLCEKALDRVGLPSTLLGKHPAELSGGQAQRVAIARALILSPKVLICDECTSALDVSVQAQILNLLRDIQCKLGTTYLFITHDMAVVSYMADEIAVMNTGRIVEAGMRKDVLGAPKDPYTRLLLDTAQAMLP